jgi:hypothetical protein
VCAGKSDHEESGKDREKADTIDEEAERNTHLGHEETGDRRTDDACAVEHRGIE